MDELWAEIDDLIGYDLGSAESSEADDDTDEEEQQEPYQGEMTPDDGDSRETTPATGSFVDLDVDDDSVIIEEQGSEGEVVPSNTTSAPYISRLNRDSPRATADGDPLYFHPRSGRADPGSFIPHTRDEPATTADEPRKRPRLEPAAGPPKSSPVATTSKDDETSRNSADECIICMDSITSHGTHRAACLVCGHIFGHECIVKWLRSADRESRDKRVCPQCKAKAKEADVRLLYTTKTTICVVDNSELEGVRSDLVAERKRLQETKEKLKSVENEQHITNVRVSTTQAENRRLAQEAADLKILVEEYKRQFGAIPGEPADPASNRPALPAAAPNRPLGLFLEFMGEYKDASARVMTFYAQEMALIMSQKLNAAHGPFGKNAGLRMINCLDFKTAELMWIPVGLIRDVSVNPANGHAVVGAMDKSIALVSLHNKSVIHKFQDDLPVWSCAWNTDDGRYFYCSLSDGSVSVYDVRNLNGRVSRLVPGVSGAQGPPAFQVAYVDRRAGHKFPTSGLLVSSANRCGFFTASTAGFDQADYSEFPRSGSQFATTYDPSTRMIARSYRPDAASSLIRHAIEELNYTPAGTSRVHVTGLHTVTRGTAAVSMYRGAFIPCGEELRLAMPDESQSAVLLWDLMDRNPKQTLKTPQLVLDVCPFVVNGRPRTALLMENGFQVYSCR